MAPPLSRDLGLGGLNPVIIWIDLKPVIIFYRTFKYTVNNTHVDLVILGSWGSGGLDIALGLGPPLTNWGLNRDTSAGDW